MKQGSQEDWMIFPPSFSCSSQLEEKQLSLTGPRPVGLPGPVVLWWVLSASTARLPGCKIISAQKGEWHVLQRTDMRLKRTIPKQSWKKQKVSLIHLICRIMACDWKAGKKKRRCYFHVVLVHCFPTTGRKSLVSAFSYMSSPLWQNCPSVVDWMILICWMDIVLPICLFLPS